MSKTKQADGEIHEDQLLNFLVNTLDEEVSLGLGANAELNAEDIYEVLVGAYTDGTSVSELCETSEDSPHQNTILYHLREKYVPWCHITMIECPDMASKGPTLRVVRLLNR